MNDDYIWSDSLRKLVAIGIVVAVLGLVFMAVWAGVNATRADRNARIAAVEACQTIEDEIVRSECIRGAS